MGEAAYVLWTTWLDYYATGEGRTVMAWIGYARDESQAREQFGKKFDPYFAQGCEVERGVVRNEITRFVWSEATLDFLEKCDPRGGAEAHACIEFNFS